MVYFSQSQSETEDDHGAIWFIVAIGASLGLAGITHVAIDPEPLFVQLLELALVSLPVLGIVYAAYWIGTHRLTENERWGIATWCIGGCLVGGLLVLGYLASEWIASSAVPDAGLLFVMGMLSGTTVGLYASISTQRHTHEEREPASLASPSPEATLLANLLSDGRSWHTIQTVTSTQQPVAIETIASEIAEREDADESSTYLDLVHARVPKLADQGLLEYDREQNVVRPGNRLTALEAGGEELAAIGSEFSR